MKDVTPKSNLELILKAIGCCDNCVIEGGVLCVYVCGGMDHSVGDYIFFSCEIFG